MDANNNSVQVLMMGARRAGKTSTLSGLYSLMNSEALKKYLTVRDVTSDEQINNSLKKKQLVIQSILKKYEGKTILMDEGHTDTFLDYTVEINIPDGGSLNITFTDANGEFYAIGDVHAESVKEKIATYDIIVIAIDTPFLMEMYNPNNRLCGKAVGLAYNQIESVHTLLCNIDDDEGKNAKLVFFVPIKCEHWAHQGKINEVTACVEQAYSTPIKSLCQYDNIEVVILPVQTIGNIVFDCHREALLLTQPTGDSISCSRIDEDTLLLSDGSLYKIQPGDIVQQDTKAKIEGYNVLRPNSWFRVVSSSYTPHNCEQLAYHILEFALTKSLALKRLSVVKNIEKRWWRLPIATIFIASGLGLLGWSLLAYYYAARRMGTVNLNKLQETINSMRADGLFMTEGEGIKILKTTNLN